MKLLVADDIGFTLIELMVVVVIVMIMALATGNAVSSGSAKAKGQAFAVMSDLNMARYEAVHLRQNVLVEFLNGNAVDDDGRVRERDGYVICADLDADDNCDSADRIFRDILLADEVEFYGADISAPAGPDVTASGEPWVAGGDGVSFLGNRLTMRPNGTSNKAGTIYLFVPGGQSGVKGGPMALVLNRIGRIRIVRWRPESSSWQTK